MEADVIPVAIFKLSLLFPSQKFHIFWNSLSHFPSVFLVEPHSDLQANVLHLVGPHADLQISVPHSPVPFVSSVYQLANATMWPKMPLSESLCLHSICGLVHTLLHDPPTHVMTRSHHLIPFLNLDSKHFILSSLLSAYLFQCDIWLTSSLGLPTPCLHVSPYPGYSIMLLYNCICTVYFSFEYSYIYSVFWTYPPWLSSLVLIPFHLSQLLFHGKNISPGKIQATFNWSQHLNG